MSSGSHVAVTLLVGAFCNSATFSSALAEPVSVEVASQKLGDALSVLAEQLKLQLVYDGKLTDGLQSPKVSGRLEPRDAFQQILNGSGLTFRFVNATTVSIERAANGNGTRVLGPVRVEGADQNSPARGEGVAQLGGIRGGQDQEERGLRPVVAAVGAGAPTAIEDIPRSVSVLTQTQIEAQDVQDFGEAIRRLPGLSMIENRPGNPASATAGTISSRGFEILTVQTDGGAPRQLDIINNGLFSLDSYERLELVRGPNGVFTGTGSPGGTINLVRKRPGAEPTLDVSVSGGSFDRLNGMVDWSTPSVFGSPLAFRGVASYDDQKFEWDNDHLKRSALYGIVDAPLGERARLEFGGQWQKIHEDGLYQGTYRYYDGPNLALPFYSNYTPEWSYLDAQTLELFSRFYVRLLEDWNFDVGLTYSDTDKRSLDSYINGSLYLLSNTNEAYQTCSNSVCTPRPTNFFARETYRPIEDLGVDFRITGKFTTWVLDHNVSLAGDYNELVGSQGERSRFSSSWTPIMTLDEFAALSHLPAPQSTAGQFDSRDDAFKDSTSSYGLTVADVVSWRERIFLTLSARYLDQESSQGSLTRRSDGAPFNISLGETISGNINRTPQWRPSWALAVKPLRPMTIYGSYSEGSQDQSTFFEPGGGQLGPMIYKNAEVGVKYGVGAWLLSGAGYKLQQDNVATQIPGSRGLCGPIPTSSCYFLSGATIESKGYDLEMSGRLFEQLDLQLSYTSNDTTQLSTNLPVETRSPEMLAKVFFNWDVPWVSRLSVNFGAIYTGRIFQSGTRTIYDPDTFRIVDQYPFEFAEPSTVIWDVGADYAINDNFRVNLLVENVADTQYYSTVSSTVNHVGNPRTAMLKVSWHDGANNGGGARSPTTGLAPFGDPSDWYGSIDIGQQYPGDWKAHSTGSSGEPIRWTFETQPTPAFGARVGYHLTDYWRTELDFGWSETEFGKVGGSGTVPYGLCSLANVGSFVGTSQDRLTHCYDPQGEAVNWRFLANVIHDFRAPEARLRPFLGVGLGATRSSVDFSGRFDGYTDSVYRSWYQTTNGRPLPAGTAVTPGEKVLGADASWGLSFQAIAGLSWHLTDQATLDLSYKFSREVLDVRTANLTDYYPRESRPDGTIETTPLTGAGLPQIGSFKGDLDSHIFSIGLRWAFGAHE